MGRRPPVHGERFFKLAGMTASVAGRYATTRLKAVFQSAEAAAMDRARSHLETGRRIARTLGELKGAVMKVGQMASIAADLLPVEVAEALQSLQREAPPVEFSVIAAQIEQELGAPPERLFHRIDPQPFASASIGQVHRAELDDGRQVVCKVQYPGVDAAVDSDLAQLKIALRASGLVRVNRAALDETFEELRARLHEELDYCNEADNVRAFRAFHRRHRFVRIPDVVGERSAKRVLTLTFEPGDALQDLDARGYDQQIRDLIGTRLCVFILSEIFELGCIHCDPHPGNFAFRPDGTLVVYDFGCAKKLPAEIVSAYGEAMRCGIAEDYAALDDTLVRLGVRDPSGPVVPAAYYKLWRDIFAGALLEDEVVDFGVSRHLREQVARQLPSAVRWMRSFQPAKDLIMLNRMLVGHYGTLRSLRTRIPLAALLQEHLDGQPQAPDAPQTVPAPCV